MFHESLSKPENPLVAGCRPVFIGKLEKFVDGQIVPITAGDIEAITFSLFRNNADTLGEYSRFTGTTPVEHWQDVQVDKEKVITVPMMYDAEYYSILGLTPFESNFHYSPDNNPILFTRSGIYQARFEFTVGDQIYPAAVQVIVR